MIIVNMIVWQRKSTQYSHFKKMTCFCNINIFMSHDIINEII